MADDVLLSTYSDDYRDVGLQPRSKPSRTLGLSGQISWAFMPGDFEGVTTYRATYNESFSPSAVACRVPAGLDLMKAPPPVDYVTTNQAAYMGMFKYCPKSKDKGKTPYPVLPVSDGVEYSPEAKVAFQKPKIGEAEALAARPPKEHDHTDWKASYVKLGSDPNDWATTTGLDYPDLKKLKKTVSFRPEIEAYEGEGPMEDLTTYRVSYVDPRRFDKRYKVIAPATDACEPSEEV